MHEIQRKKYVGGSLRKIYKSNESNEKPKVQKSLFSTTKIHEKQYFAKNEIYFIQGHIWRNSAKGNNSRVKIGDRRANFPKMSFWKKKSVIH